MTIYTITAAKKHFTKLLEEVLSGNEIIIKRGTKPIARVVKIPVETETERVE
jgi:prevent-host-death family protein